MRTICVEGCGFFPFVPSEPIIPSEAPVSLTLTEAMRWYWRVRTWSFAVNLTHTTSTGVSAITGTLVAAHRFGGPAGTLIENESFLTMPSSAPSTAWTRPYAAHGVVDDLTPATRELRVRLCDGIAGGPDADDLWRPFIDIEVSGASDPLVSVNTGAFTTAGATCTIAGQSVPLYYVPIAGSTYTGTIIGTPTSFWPNANRDGSEPIYHAATGVELRDPFAYDATP